MGLRNPFRIAQRPDGPQSWYIGDVGWGAWEELNRAPGPATPPGSPPNFGWPCREGPDATPYEANFTGPGECPVAPANRTEPLHAYDSSGVDHAIIGGAFYTGSTFPAAWRAAAGEAAFYYSDYPSGEITFVRTGAADQKLEVTRFGGGFAGPTMVTEGPADPQDPSGPTALYLVDLGPLDEAGGKIWRIAYTG